jgi:hypothetical protein
VLVLTQESEQGRLGVTLKKTAEAGRGTRPPAWPEARGLSVSDLHSRAPLTGWVIDGGAESGFGGLIGRKVMGKGVAVFAQIAPIVWMSRVSLTSASRAGARRGH